MSDPNDDAVSDGWLCDRGRYNIAFYADGRRVTSPMLRDGSEFVQIGWDDAIALWAKHLRDAIATAGPRSIATLGGGRLLNEEIVLLARIMRDLGVDNLDWRAGRQRQASPGSRDGSYADLDAAQAIVAFGRPPSQTAPVLDLRIRKAVTRHAARFVTVGPHPAGSFVAATRVDRASDLDALLEGVERLAIVWDGIDVAAGRDAARTADALAARGVAVSCFVAGEQNNARGAEALGMLPRSGGFDTAATFAAARDGKLRVLSLFGVNPVLHHPLGGAAVRAALANVPFVVATELFLTETAELAHLVLPARASFEKSGHVYDLTGAPHGVFAGHAAPDGTLADGDMLVALAAELGLDVPAPDELLAAANAPAVAIAAGFADAILTGTPDVDASSRPAGGGLRLAIASHIFSGGGTAAFDDRLGGLRPIATATFAPFTAAEAGVTPGDTIDLFAGERTLRDLTVAVDADLGADTVVVIDGLPSAPANALATGDAVAIGNVRSAYGALAAGAV